MTRKKLKRKKSIYGSLIDFYRKKGLRALICELANLTARKIWETRIAWTPRQLYIPKDRIRIDRPIFLLGVQGGGLTIIQRMIRRHPQIVTIAGNSYFWAGNDVQMQVLANTPEDFALTNVALHNLRGTERNHPIFGHSRDWTYATDDLLKDYRKTEKDFKKTTAEKMRTIIKKSIRAYSHNIHKARFIDMSQSFSLKVPLLKKIFPKARFVLITRNPYAVCWGSATRKTGKYSYWKLEPPLEKKIKYISQHWRNTFETALKDFERLDAGIVIRLEDFLRDPEKNLRKIMSYIELDFREDLLPSSKHKIPLGSVNKEKWHPLNKEVNEKYLADITPEATEIIKNIVGDIASKLGYHPPKKPNDLI